MAEAEDVIVDAARHATSYTLQLWRRNRPHAVDEAPGAALADVRERLALLVEGATGAVFPIRTAAAPPPLPLLARLFDRGRRLRSPSAVPGADGESVHLPARYADGATASALDCYRAAVLQQGLRCLRGTLRAYPWHEPLLIQDLYLLAETAAVHAQLLARLPGLESMLARVRGEALAARPPADAPAEPLRAVETLYRSWLAAGVLPGAALPVDPPAALAWARSFANTLQPGRYTGLPADILLGEALKGDAAGVAQTTQASAPQHAAPQMQKLARRPRAREAADGEDDEHTGAWMIQTAQPSEHVEDAMGLQRPVDQEPDADLQGAGESVSDLEELRLVSTPGTAREILVPEDNPLARKAKLHGQPASSPGALAYPEWDYTVSAYHERAAVVRLLPCAEGSRAWVDATLAKHHATLTRVRRRFEALRSRRSVEHAQPEGDDLDLDAFVSAHGDRRARLPRPDRLYLAHRPARRDFSLLVLIDVSGSTDAWAGADRRVIDLEKEALVVVSAALEALRVRFAIQSFTGCGPGDVRMSDVKSFDEAYERRIAQRIAGLEPDEYTRAGAALRHAARTLMREPAHRRLLLLLSDGKPNDCDRYEGRYGVEDMRQALAETRLQGIAPFCVTVDRLASRHLAPLFGPGNYTIVREPGHLAGALLDWLRSVTVAIA